MNEKTMNDFVQIKTLEDLQSAVNTRKSVFCHSMHRMGTRRLPAAIAINFQGAYLLRLFWAGMYVYEKGIYEIFDREKK